MEPILAVYIYGSVGRGESDDRSDLDILAVVEEHAGRTDDKIILRDIPCQFAHLRPSISWYGQNRIRQMYQQGELFAWHLYAESFPIYQSVPFLSSLGKPKDYRGGMLDIECFKRVLGGIPSQLTGNEANAVYEAGLLYVCVRNIAMAASWTLCGKPDFSRLSPFHLKNVRACPLSLEQYQMSMQCRMASQRGDTPPPVVASLVAEMYDKLSPWIDEIRGALIKDKRR